MANDTGPPRSRGANWLIDSIGAGRVSSTPTPPRPSWSAALLAAGALSVDVADPARRHARGDAALRRAGRARRRCGRYPVDRALRAGHRPAIASRVAREADCGGQALRRTRRFRSPSRTGCARRRRNSRRSGSPRASGSFRRGAQRPIRRAINLRARSGPRVRHGLASDHAALPALARARAPMAANRCSITAAARASSRSPRAGWAPVAFVGTDIDPQALAASRANARANGVAAMFVAARPARADGADALRRRRRQHSRQPAGAARACARGCGCARAARIVLSGILDAQAEDVITAYGRWFNIGVSEGDEGWVVLAGTRLRDDAGLAGSDPGRRQRR